jgi:hypothetical protein
LRWFKPRRVVSRQVNSRRKRCALHRGAALAGTPPQPVRWVTAIRCRQSCRSAKPHGGDCQRTRHERC